MDQLTDPNAVERRLVDKANEARIPLTAAFELTPLCNLKCDMCYVRMDRKETARYGGLRSVSQWLRTAEELREAGTLFILLTGGEPLLYPGFRELYAELKQMGFILTLNTNATLVTDDVALFLSRQKPRRVNATLYGLDNGAYARLCHAPQGFDRCMQGLRRLKAHGIDTKITLTIVKKNRADYARLLDIARSLGMPAHINSYMSTYCQPTCTTQGCIPALRLEAEEAAAAEVAYLKYKQGEGFHPYACRMVALTEGGFSSVPEGVGLTCRAGKSSCWINWRGIMTPCVDMDEPSAPVAAGAQEAWAQVSAGCRTLPKHTECAGCALRTVCDVCYANASNEKRNTGSVDYLCAMARAKQRLLADEARRGESGAETGSHRPAPETEPFETPEPWTASN